MKLRFGIDEAAYARIRDALDAAAPEPPVGKTLSYVYLDTPEGELAERGVALRFRRSSAVGMASPRRPWRKQWIWPKGEGPRSFKALGIRRLKQRVDATFSVRIERWTWRPKSWAEVSLDRVALSAGRAGEDAIELRLRCRKGRREDATQLAMKLGAANLASRRTRERGQALLRAEELTNLDLLRRDGDARPPP